MSDKQKITLSIVLLIIAGLIITFTYYKPSNDAVVPPPKASQTLEDFIKENPGYNVFNRSGIIYVGLRGPSVKIIDTGTILGKEWQLPVSIGEGVVRSPLKNEIIFALIHVFRSQEAPDGFFADSRIYMT